VSEHWYTLPHCNQKSFLIIALFPDCDRRTTSGKALYAAFLGSLKQNEIAIDGEEYELALSIADAINITKEHLNVDFIKTELMIQSEDAGVPIKSSLDAIGSDGYIYDIKTCEAADARSFMGNVLNYKYYLQAYFYLNIYRKVFEQDLKGFRFIAVEKSPPYASAVFTLGTEFMNRGFEDYERGLKLFKQCSESKNWPDYPKEVQVLDLAPKQPANNTPITFA
jgi:hypothetical protein